MNSGGDLLQIAYDMFHHTSQTLLHYHVKPSHTHTQHTTVLLLVWNMSGSTRVSRYQKGKTKKVKTNLDLLEQETVSGSGICWAICNAYLLPSTSCKVSPCGRHMGSPPIVHTHRVSPGSLSEIKKRALPPPVTEMPALAHHY